MKSLVGNTLCFFFRWFCVVRWHLCKRVVPCWWQRLWWCQIPCGWCVPFLRGIPDPSQSAQKNEHTNHHHGDSIIIVETLENHFLQTNNSQYYRPSTFPYVLQNQCQIICCRRQQSWCHKRAMAHSLFLYCVICALYVYVFVCLAFRG